METSTPEATTSATASEGVIGNKACGHEDDRREASESIAKHGHSSLLI
jgi:hypothetical protein